MASYDAVVFDRLIRRRSTRPEPNADGFQKTRISVLGRHLAFIERGTGPPMVFVQGSVASSTSWTRVLSHVSQDVRSIAVDLVGTGDSERIIPCGDDTYTLAAHRPYFDTFMSVVTGGAPVVLVVQGWGSMVALDWAARHPASVRAICHLEAVVRPLRKADFERNALDELTQARGAEGAEFVLDTDQYLELAMRQHVADPLSPGAAAEYRRSFGPERNSRRAVLAGLRSIPIDGHPQQSHLVVRHYWNWLCAAEVPKLAIFGEPGYLTTGRLRKDLTDLPNQTVFSVIGSHLLQEDSPDGVGTFLGAWYRQRVAGG